jgi:hypothetical protein
MATCKKCKSETSSPIALETMCLTEEDNDKEYEYKPVNLCEDCSCCSYCGKRVKQGDNYYILCFCTDTLLCDDCEGNEESHYWCTICSEHQLDYDFCHHIYKPVDFEHQGAGSWYPTNNDDGYFDDFTPAFNEFLSFVGLKLALDLRLTISRRGHVNIRSGMENIYHEEWHGWNESYGSDIENYCKLDRFELHIEKLKEEDYNKAQIFNECFLWLASLDKQAPEVNRFTINLIDNWLKDNATNYFTDKIYANKETI